MQDRNSLRRVTNYSVVLVAGQRAYLKFAPAPVAIPVP